MAPRPRGEASDVLVIGAGAAGAAATWRLASAGLDVVCLERGDWPDWNPHPSLTDAWESRRVRDLNPNPNIRRGAADYPVEDDETPIKPIMFCGVGGSTVMWSAHAPRFHPSDFRTRSLDGVGDDWPLTYWELEPYYDLNDRMSGVSGLAGDPANPPRSPRQTPPVPLGPGGAKLAAAFDRLGWHWWPSDGAVNRDADPATGRDGCNNCGPCGLGCPRRARASTDVTYWPQALERGARLVTGATVARIACDRDGRAVSVDWIDETGALRHTAADLVILAANGVGTPRLLLASASAAHPAGIGNARDGVGRHLMHHPTAIVTGLFDEPTGLPEGPFACSLYSQEFYETDPARGAVRGYQMQGLRPQGPLATAIGGYARRLPWGRGHHDVFERTFGHDVSLTVTVEDLPAPDNRVTLDASRRDRAGVPAARLMYRLGRNERRLLDHGIARASEVLREAGAREIVVTPLFRAAGFHFLGTAAMGADEDAVTDAEGRVRGCPGLVVVDGSLFPSAGGVNPTPTLQANALRIADAILARAPLRAARATVAREIAA